MLRLNTQALFALALALFSSIAFAGDCVIPKAKTLPTGNLDRKFINIHFKPDPASGIFVKVAAPVGFEVVGEEGGWWQVAGVPNSPFKNGEVLGWIRKSEVNSQPWRNCS